MLVALDVIVHEDTYSSRPILVELMEYLSGCNIDYWDETSEFYQWDYACFSEDLLS
jgi:hypothetical protein